MHPLWKVLPFNRGNTAPPFLVCVQFDRESYEIYLTDLTYCWKEKARREDIIRRSLEGNTSIDPSEDAQQMQLFLDKLCSAFTGGLDTGLKIKAIKSKKQMTGSDLSIEASAVLPRPLKPLLWPMHFQLLPESEFTDRVTIPLFEAQNARLAEMESLLGKLKEKDHVIHKLVDKLDASGTDLGQIFPGANGRGGRKISRQDAEARIKGLGAFAENTWRKEMENNDEDHHWESITDLIGDGKMKFPLVNRVSGNTDWFEWLDVSKRIPLDSKFDKDQIKSKVDHKITPKPSQDEIKNESDGEDDFQVQATPPHHEPSSKKKDPATNADSNDEDDLDAPSQRSISQRSVIPDSVPIEPLIQPSSKPKKLGTIGGIQKPSKTRSPSPPPQKSPPVAQSTDDAMDDDQATATEDEAPTPPPAKPKKMGLGMIGGKKKEVTPAVEVAPPSPKVAKQESPAPAKKAKGRLGMIGHKAKEVETVNEAEPRGRAQTKEATPPPVRETSLERADRKRQELKRELEAKAKAPVKKKRKF